MNRSTGALLGLAAVAACGDLNVGSGLGAVEVSPVLDSLIVGDRLPALRVTYIAPDGKPASPGQIIWASSDTSIAQIDTLAGGITARKRGAVIITARAQGQTGGALVVVSDTLDITLLLDTVYMMPGDTMTVPVVVLKSNPPAATVWFTAPSNSAYTIDSASGQITALDVGGPLPYIVHADSLADTGAVYVKKLADTTGGKIFYSVRGTVISHVGGPAHAVNFLATSGRQAFQLTGTYVPNGAPTQRVQVTRPDSLIAAGAYLIDSLSPAEDPFSSTAPPATCAAPRPWATWTALNVGIAGYSRRGGTLVVMQIDSVPGGQVISGHFTFTAQRATLYTDPLGLLSITGSFVAPLVSSSTVCR